MKLGMLNIHAIRMVIRAHVTELAELGNISAKPINSGKRGRPATAFYLNEEQALLICLLSKTEKAK